MEQLKELFEKQNRLLEAQNKILKEGFEALIWGLAETAPSSKFSNAMDRLKEFRKATKEQTQA